MPHWKLTLSYDGGAGFHGWQVQPSLRTIQGVLADTIHRTFGERILPQGSGRTDTGVHALSQVCTFTLTADIPPANLQRALNRVLPPSIRITHAELVPADFHARHSALAKTYLYRLFERRAHAATEPSSRLQPPRIYHEGAAERTALGTTTNLERILSPFLAPYVWDCRWPLALGPMQQAAQNLRGTHDFTSFAATDLDKSSRTTEDNSTSANTRTIHAAHWSRLSEDTLEFRITGNGFLHHMVRNIVGTLADIGRGALPADSIPAILAARNRAAAGPTAPAQGLFLFAVHYDEAALAAALSIARTEHTA